MKQVRRLDLAAPPKKAGRRPVRRAYVVGGVCFVPHPEYNGYWIRTDTCVVKIVCSACHAEIGEPCKAVFGMHPTGKYGSSTHWQRRHAAKGVDYPNGRELRLVIDLP